jgi:hypothetical protein
MYRERRYGGGDEGCGGGGGRSLEIAPLELAPLEVTVQSLASRAIVAQHESVLGTDQGHRELLELRLEGAVLSVERLCAVDKGDRHARARAVQPRPDASYEPWHIELHLVLDALGQHRGDEGGGAARGQDAKQPSE